MSPDQRSRAKELLDRCPIFTDDRGRPVGCRPEVIDFDDFVKFLAAFLDYRQAAADLANAVFTRYFSKLMACNDGQEGRER